MYDLDVQSDIAKTNVRNGGDDQFNQKWFALGTSARLEPQATSTVTSGLRA